jgi:hypothetical protein
MVSINRVSLRQKVGGQCLKEGEGGNRTELRMTSSVIQHYHAFGTSRLMPNPRTCQIIVKKGPAGEPDVYMFITNSVELSTT